MKKIHYKDLVEEVKDEFTQAKIKSNYFINNNLVSIYMYGNIAEGGRNYDVKNFINYDLEKNTNVKLYDVINESDFANYFNYNNLTIQPEINEESFIREKQKIIEQCYSSDFSEFYFDCNNIYVYVEVKEDRHYLFITIPYCDNCKM